MGGSHAHGRDIEADTARGPRRVLLATLALAGVATVIGLVVLWPTSSPPSVQYAAEGVTFPTARVLEVNEPCPVIVADPTRPAGGGEGFPEGCDEVRVEVLEGSAKGVETAIRVPPGTTDSGLRKGDVVKVVAIPAQDDRPASYAYFGTERGTPILAMTVAFVLVVAVVARVRGLLALLGLLFAGVVLARFMLPALLLGSSGLGVALVGSSAIMFVVLYLAHGISVRTSTALAGTLVGVGVTALLGLYAVDAARLSGLGDESGELLRAQAPEMNFQGLLTCAVIVAGLGVLNDVTITQSSAVWELRAAAPEMTRRQLFASGMRIGRDHIASTIYTIVFAYAGTSLVVLLLLSLYDRPMLDLLTDEAIAEEVLRTLASAIGLVLAVPATTAIATATVAPARPAEPVPAAPARTSA
jgi:uncharacterized membrane protein